jgi:hypothetical protein
VSCAREMTRAQTIAAPQQCPARDQSYVAYRCVIDWQFQSMIFLGPMKDGTTHTGNSRKRIFRILKWVIGSIVAMSIIVVVAAGATAIIDRRVAFEKLTPKERHLAIYDAFCTQIKRHYFDSSFSGVDWNEIDQKWREKAAAATTDSELYANVLSNIGLQFPASHIAVQVPSRLPAKSANEDEAVAARTRGVVSLLVDGPGFDYVTIRRGSSTGSIVGDVVRGSAADRAGIERGSSPGGWPGTLLLLTMPIRQPSILPVRL